jgi:hypothetical protein
MSEQRNAHLNPVKTQTPKNLSGKLNTWSVTFKTFIDMSGWDLGPAFSDW